MMGKPVSLGIIVFFCLFTGCVEPPPSPLGSIPRVLIDHIEEGEETKVYIHGLEDHLYSNITIEINDDHIAENYTYSLHLSTILDKFVLNVTVWDEAKEYEYTGNYTILQEDDQISLEIYDDRHDDPIKRSMPYSIIMERKE